MIELRSDTFTLPTDAMRQAMVRASLGDDGYGEDPTVRELEELAAELLGKPAACLMPSGTMANLASMLALASRGSTILVGDEADIWLYEAGGASVLGGAVYQPVPTQPDGRLLLEDLAHGFPPDPDDPQFAWPSLICLENTHNRCGGVPLPPDYLRQVRRFARARNLPVHLDGARIFNAAVAFGVAPRELAEPADSVQFCLSKGLGAPIGSMVVGDHESMRRIRRIRKLLGGGMRQAGVVAAAGIVALHDYLRLARDHAHAQLMAAGLAAIPGIEVNPWPQTNIVLFTLARAPDQWRQLVSAARAEGVALGGFGRHRIRAVTHRGVGADEVAKAVSVIERLVRNGFP